jgi:hypothetical protein
MTTRNFSIFFARPLDGGRARRAGRRGAVLAGSAGSSPASDRDLEVAARVTYYDSVSSMRRSRVARRALPPGCGPGPPCALALDLSDARRPRRADTPLAPTLRVYLFQLVRVASPESRYRDALSYVALRPWDTFIRLGPAPHK